MGPDEKHSTLRTISFQPEEEALITNVKKSLQMVKGISSPRIPKLLGIYSDQKRLFLHTAVGKLETLADHIQKNGPLFPEKPELILGIVSEVLRALDEYHGVGFAHGDVRPENVLLVPNPGLTTGLKADIVLTNFSLARSLPSFARAQLASGVMRGYFSPERLGSGRYSPPSDVWAAAILMHQIVVGKPAFVGEVGLDFTRAVRELRLKNQFPGSTNAQVIRVFEKLAVPDPTTRIKAADAALHIEGICSVLTKPMRKSTSYGYATLSLYAREIHSKFSWRKAIQSIAQFAQLIQDMGPTMFRDLRPSNVLVNVHTLECHLISQLDSSLQMFQQSPNDACYIPPSIALGSPFTAKDAVWQLGMVLLTMVAGGPPYTNMEPQQIQLALREGLYSNASLQRHPKLTQLIIGAINEAEDLPEFIERVKQWSLARDEEVGGAKKSPTLPPRAANASLQTIKKLQSGVGLVAAAQRKNQSTALPAPPRVLGQEPKLQLLADCERVITVSDDEPTEPSHAVPRPWAADVEITMRQLSAPAEPLKKEPTAVNSKQIQEESTATIYELVELARGKDPEPAPPPAAAQGPKFQREFKPNAGQAEPTAQPVQPAAEVEEALQGSEIAEHGPAPEPASKAEAGPAQAPSKDVEPGEQPDRDMEVSTSEYETEPESEPESEPVQPKDLRLLTMTKSIREDPGQEVKLFTAEETHAMRELVLQRPCACGGASRNVFEAATNRCAWCCNAFKEQAGRADPEDTEWGSSAMMNAVVSNSPACVVVLLEKDVGLQDTQGNTALITAASNGLVDIVRLLAPAEQKMADNAGATALFSAASNGHVACVRALRAFESGLQKTDGQTALMGALADGQEECALLLIEQEAYYRDTGGQTALMYAAEKGLSRAVEALVSWEAGLQDSSRRCALARVAAFCSEDGLEEFARCAAALWPFEEERNALSERDFLALAEKFQLQETEDETLSRLRLYTEEELALKIAQAAQRRCICHGAAGDVFRAAELGCPSCCLAYMEQAGRINERDDWKCSALLNAVVSNSPDCAVLLLEKDAGLVDRHGNTALITAASNGLTECVRLLIGAEAGFQDNKGSTALHTAAFNGHADCVQVLAHREAGIRKKDGCTALMCAAQEGHLRCLHRLFMAERGLVDNEGVPALAKTLLKGKRDCAAFLWQFPEERERVSVWAKLSLRAKFGLK